MTTHHVVGHDGWMAARKKHLAKEKEFTRLRDQLSAERRELPWEAVEKEYTFEGANGRQSLAEIFEGRGQLVIYHAMFNPETAGEHTSWTSEAACNACSFWLDNLNGIGVHLNHRDITIAAVSRATYPKIAAYKERMGWTFPWYSSVNSDFNFDYGVSFSPEELETGEVEYNYRLTRWSGTEAPGISVFIKEGEQIFHTYSKYERGLDMLNVAYHYIDLVPKGRDEGDAGLGEWSTAETSIRIDVAQRGSLRREADRAEHAGRHVHGSGNLAQTLIRHGLVDEYHLWFSPVLGQGKRLFADGTVPATLRLVDSKISKTGVFMGTYEPAGEVVTARSRVSSGRMNRE